MAHSNATKAQACALLLLGNSVRYVSEQTNVPRSTVGRWRQEVVKPIWRDIAKQHNLGAELAQFFRR